MLTMKFCAPNTSSITQRTRCRFSSLICTNMLPVSASSSRAICQSVAQVGEIGVDAERPGVAVRPDHLRLAGEVLPAVLHVALAELGLEVRREPDAVRRVDVDHLDLAGEILPPGEAGHDLERVAQDHAVRPVDVVPIELHRLRVLLLRSANRSRCTSCRASTRRIACVETRSCMCRATGSTSNHGFSRLPLHSSHGSCRRSASASTVASSSVSAR